MNNVFFHSATEAFAVCYESQVGTCAKLRWDASSEFVSTTVYANMKSCCADVSSPTAASSQHDTVTGAVDEPKSMVTQAATISSSDGEQQSEAASSLSIHTVPSTFIIQMTSARTIAQSSNQASYEKHSMITKSAKENSQNNKQNSHQLIQIMPPESNDLSMSSKLLMSSNLSTDKQQVTIENDAMSNSSATTLLSPKRMCSIMLLLEPSTTPSPSTNLANTFQPEDGNESVAERHTAEEENAASRITAGWRADHVIMFCVMLAAYKAVE